MATDLASVALDGELVDEDKAKAIAEQDLRSSRKQVHVPFTSSSLYVVG